MLETALREQTVESTRRRGYLVLCACSVTVHAVIAARELPQGNWRAALVALLSAALLPAVLSRRVPLWRLDTLLVWSANIGAVYFLWDIHARGLSLGARESLIVLLFFVIWFGLLPLRRAALRGGLVYAALLLVSSRPPVDPVPPLYIGFLLFLIGQMTVAGRQIQRELSRSARYADLALTDPLTGLLNRRALERHLEDHDAARSHAAGTGAGPPPPLGVLLIDIDLFKAVNDTHGHAVGDRVLVALGQTLRTCARSGDLVARWGGEEFLLLVRTGECAVLEQICGRIQRTLAENGQTGPGEARLPAITVSIGAALSDEVRGAAGLLKLADRRLYRAKNAGRARMNMDALHDDEQVAEADTPAPELLPHPDGLRLAASR